MRTAIEFNGVKIELNEPSPTEYERFTKRTMFIGVAYDKLRDWLIRFEAGEVEGEDLIKRAANQYQAAFDGFTAMRDTLIEMLKKCKAVFDEKPFDVSTKEGALNVVECVRKIVELGPSEDELKNSQPGCGSCATPTTH